MECKAPDDKYLFIVHLALQRYSLETKECYKLTDWKQIFEYPDIVKSAYVAIDLWRTEKFVSLEQDKLKDAKFIYLALLNA